MSNSRSPLAQAELAFVGEAWKRIGIERAPKYIPDWSEFEEYIKSDSFQLYRCSSGPLEKDFAEQVVQMENDAVLAGISEATAAELAQINRALAQLDQGTYGICSRCGQPIAGRRLQALPYSDRCISCAEAGG